MSGGYSEAREALGRAAATVVGVRVLSRPGIAGDPPLVYVQPPTLTWERFDLGPSEAVFEVILAVAADENAIERLFELLDPVCNAIENARDVDADVVSAEPGLWRAGNTELPAYFIRTEVAV